METTVRGTHISLMIAELAFLNSRKRSTRPFRTRALSRRSGWLEVMIIMRPGFSTSEISRQRVSRNCYMLH